MSCTRQSGETMTAVSAGHILLIPIQPVGSMWPQQGSKPGPLTRSLSYRPPTPTPPRAQTAQNNDEYIIVLLLYLYLKIMLLPYSANLRWNPESIDIRCLIFWFNFSVNDIFLLYKNLMHIVNQNAAAFP